MQSSKLRASNQQNPIPVIPTTIWYQLPPTSQQQLAHLVAQLIQRVRGGKLDKEQNHER
jgi:hypothetical protein